MLLENKGDRVPEFEASRIKIQIMPSKDSRRATLVHEGKEWQAHSIKNFTYSSAGMSGFVRGRLDLYMLKRNRESMGAVVDSVLVAEGDERNYLVRFAENILALNDVLEVEKDKILDRINSSMLKELGVFLDEHRNK